MFVDAVSAAILSPSTVSAGPLYLRLVPMCTIFIMLGLHHRKSLATGVAPLLPCISHITYIHWKYNLTYTQCNYDSVMLRYICIRSDSSCWIGICLSSLLKCSLGLLIVGNFKGKNQVVFISQPYTFMFPESF